MSRRNYREDPYQLQRFIDAQSPVWPVVREELAAGEKRSHWMWFIFPQLRGLGSSFMAQRFAISGLKEARAYLAHPLLGTRLRTCTGLVNAVEGRTLSEIFGPPDNVKFHSSITLFAEAAITQGTTGNEAFAEALDKFFDGVPDAATMKLLPVRERAPDLDQSGEA